MITSFRKGHPAGEKRRVPWAHRPRVARALLLGSQVILALLLFLVVVNALILPFLFDQEVDGPTPIGEVIGAEIVMALAVWALTVAFVKTRRRRRMAAQLTVEEAVAPVV